MIAVILNDWNDGLSTVRAESYGSCCGGPSGCATGLFWGLGKLPFLPLFCRKLPFLPLVGLERGSFDIGVILVFFGEWRVVCDGYRLVEVVGWWFS